MSKAPPAPPPPPAPGQYKAYLEALHSRPMLRHFSNPLTAQAIPMTAPQHHHLHHEHQSNTSNVDLRHQLPIDVKRRPLRAPPPPVPDLTASLEDLTLDRSLPPSLSRKTSLSQPPRKPLPSIPNNNKPSISDRFRVGSPDGGWKSGYPTSPQHHNSANQLPFFHSAMQHHSSLALLALDTSGIKKTVDTSQAESKPLLITAAKPSLETGYTNQEVDLADFVDETLPLILGGERYTVDGCVATSEYGFVLKAHLASRHQKKKSKNGSNTHVDKHAVYIKMISRESDSYRSIGRLMNPAHTDLAMMLSQVPSSSRRSSAMSAASSFGGSETSADVKVPRNAGRNLPQYIDHYWIDAKLSPNQFSPMPQQDSIAAPRCDYLAIVTKTHGVKKNLVERVGGSGGKYRDVEWIMYFQQAA